MDYYLSVRMIFFSVQSFGLTLFDRDCYVQSLVEILLLLAAFKGITTFGGTKFLIITR